MAIVERQFPEDLPLDLNAEAHFPADRSSIAYRQGLAALGLGRSFTAKREMPRHVSRPNPGSDSSQTPVQSCRRPCPARESVLSVSGSIALCRASSDSFLPDELIGEAPSSMRCDLIFTSFHTNPFDALLVGWFTSLFAKNSERFGPEARIQTRLYLRDMVS